MIEITNQVVWSVLAVVALSYWWRLRSTSAAWLAATFGSFALVILQSLLIPEIDPADQPLPQFSAMEIYIDVLVIVLISFPYLLHRFTRSLTLDRIRGSRVLDVWLIAMIVATFAQPGFPPPDVKPAGAFAVYYFSLLGFFAVPLVQVTWVLWRLGRRQPGVVKQRMRLMSAAAALLTASIVVSTIMGASEEPLLLPAALGWASAIAFLLAFQPPPPVRRLWRAKEEEALREAEHGLLSANTPTDAAQAVVSIAPALVGGTGATIHGVDGELLAAHGDVEEASDAAGHRGAGEELRIEGQTVRLRVLPGTITPVFGRGEEELLGQLAGHLDLALNRLAALRESQESLVRAQRANEELHQLVYGISHDLRNPLVTILGFLGVFDSDGHEGLTEQQILARDRIGVSAAYMESLVEDLLQLSRVGRMDADAAYVDLSELITDIAGDVSATEEAFTVQVTGEGVAQMNPVRARQLFTNLIVNAARHGGVRPLNITVDMVRKGDRIHLTFSDNGVGIPAEDREKVFRIFQRLQRFDAGAKGSGIGLTMCRSIVEDVGGSIAITPTESGTTFQMHLPAATDLPATKVDSTVKELA